MNAAFILMTSAWLAGGDPCCDTCSACSKVKPTLCQRIRDWCQSQKCNDCCEAPKPVCCEAPKPVCCPAPKCEPCCDPCERKHPFAGLFHRNNCCEPTCCEAPKCDDCCDSGCGGGLLQRLFGHLHGRDDCCDPCCNGAAPSAEPIGAPKEQPKKMPEGGKTHLINPVVIPSQSGVPF